MTVKLSRRLAAVARHVPRGSMVADIGTDHAILPVYLVREGVASRAVAGEVGTGPYNIALEAVRSQGLDRQVSVRLGDGLQVLSPGEVNVIVLAGMGGRTICRILTGGQRLLDRVERLVIQPMRDTPLVRRWLLANGWCLADEDMVYEDGHYYVIMEARPGRENVKDELIIKLGPRLLEKRDPVYRNFLLQRQDKIRDVLDNLRMARTPRAVGRANRLQRESAMIKEVLQDW